MISFLLTFVNVSGDFYNQKGSVIFNRLTLLFRFLYKYFTAHSAESWLNTMYYIINKNEDEHGRNEVHTTTCNHLPLLQNQVTLGWHSDAVAAVAYAKLMGWKNADGCYYCCNSAHRG